jgi:hypothetical protein
MPMSKRAKWKIFRTLVSAISFFRFGAAIPLGGICTTSAEPSPGESCTTQSRSRFGSSPIASVSTATAGPV